MVAAKNFSTTAAAQDLGLGDQLKQQLDDAEEERKRKLLSGTGGQGGLLGEATRTLFPGTFSV